MATNAERARWGRKAAGTYQSLTHTGIEDAVCDLVCDLMHFAESMGQDASEEVRRGIYHWWSETHNEAHCIVTIDVEPATLPEASEPPEETIVLTKDMLKVAGYDQKAISDLATLSKLMALDTMLRRGGSR